MRHPVAVAALLAAALLAAATLVEPAALLAAAADLAASRWFLPVVLGLFVVRPLLAVPMSLLFVLVGWRYGVVAGLPVALLGTAVTTFPPYLVGRYLRTDAGLLGRLCRRGERAFDATGDLRGVVAVRLAPIPAESVSYGAGAAGVRPAAYVLGTLVGELPWVLGYLLLGHSMQVLAFEDVSVDGRFLVVVSLAAVLLVAPTVLRWVRGRREGSSERSTPAD